MYIFVSVDGYVRVNEWSTHRGNKKASNTLDLEFEVALSCQVDARNRALGLMLEYQRLLIIELSLQQSTYVFILITSK